MKSFLNLNPEESITLHKAVYRNALNLKKDANTIKEINKSYCSATSLLILSSEEVIKAILVLLHSEGYKVYLLKDAKKFFLDHKIRHEISKLIETGSGLLESTIKWDEVKDEKLFSTRLNWFNEIANGILNISKLAQPILDSISHIEHLQIFDNLKNGGFYVDYYNELLEPSKIVSEHEYYKVEVTIKRIFAFYKVLRIIHHPSLKKHMSEREIEGLKNNLKVFIKDTLKGYDFKNTPQI
ncbi:AbiV family abortive infection protein [Lacinutrix neustonica]|uniref:AbiV family abortive infection protein n=1 Tax=Lacinutrix neustonica TaxID=2980107 RepID=A0A9E8SGF6_9FLAO|nr:AbiV family abortive infection protein [Lacinutrix neustonica]WAC01685.1 AbiV family abortive infection protein [Lacinutrix neustonica]